MQGADSFIACHAEFIITHMHVIHSYTSQQRYLAALDYIKTNVITEITLKQGWQE